MKQTAVILHLLDVNSKPLSTPQATKCAMRNTAASELGLHYLLRYLAYDNRFTNAFDLFYFFWLSKSQYKQHCMNDTLEFGGERVKLRFSKYPLRQLRCLVQNIHCDSYSYCASHILVQPNFRRYNFYFLPDQAQTHLDYFNVLDEL